MTTQRILGEHFNSAGRPKRRFKTKPAAEKFIRECKLQVHPYHCSVCHSWHLASY